VDCGINAIQEVELAQKHQMDVLITDHHLPDQQLPPAKAITNPQLDDQDEFKQLSGTGVALKLALSTLDLFDQCPISNSQFESFLSQSLVMTAIATVADVMELKGLNRALVQHALARLDELENPGLQALIKMAKIKTPATTEDLSFQLIPRINSAQRMEKGHLIWELLNSSTTEEAQTICAELEKLNTERRALLEQHAQNVLSELSTKNFEQDTAIIVEGKDWLEGFSGLIAQRVIQKYQKPAIVMLSKEDDSVVASCRSPEGWHLKHALDQCQDFLIASGGHAQAAGFRTHTEHLPDLKSHLQTCLEQQGQKSNSNTKLAILHELNFREINMGLYESLKILEPHGQGNPKPVFATKGLLFDGDLRFMGKDKTHVGFQAFQPGMSSLSAIAFGMAEHFRELDVHTKFDLAYTLSISPYRPQLQLQVLGIRPHRTATLNRSSRT
jgi:single-stranded-DNA-specific exonuclease